MSSEIPSPVEIAAELEKRVIGQTEAVREMAVALSKKLGGASVGNILMIGSSGSGKTTLMRAVEAYLSSNEDLAELSTTVRVHANVLAEDAATEHRGQVLLDRLLNRARQQLGAASTVESVVDRASKGLVFVDEVDKIRSRIGGVANTDGIRAQEALLTLIENESVPCTLPSWAGGGLIEVDSRGILFVCAGAFEGLYDAVYDRVTVGSDRGALKAITVIEEGEVREERPFVLRDWLQNQDLYDYGMTPQFLSRFDAVVLLNVLLQDDLVTIFLESPESGFHETRDYFASRGIDLAISPSAVRRIAQEAARRPRIGARALKEVFHRVIRDYEFDPSLIERSSGQAIMIDLPEVEAALES